MSTIAPPITDAQERVRRGAALLDEHGPENWRDCVDLGNLNISHACDCVLGQVYGHYTEGLARLGLTSGEAHGFTANGATTNDWREELGA